MVRQVLWVVKFAYGEAEIFLIGNILVNLLIWLKVIGPKRYPTNSRKFLVKNGVGTEEGDFSRVTDFDPDFIKMYYTLFAKAADSNVTDLNSRSTISGFCDISMPFKIDIMLTASNYAREEAGITRYENPENFLLYRDSHGERKEKATSSDNPNFQRTLLRYTSDKNHPPRTRPHPPKHSPNT